MLFDAIRRRRQEKADSQQAWLARWQSLVPEENRNVPVTVEGQTRIAYIQINQFVVMLQDGLLMKAHFFDVCEFFQKAGYHVVWLMRCVQDVEGGYLKLVKKGASSTNADAIGTVKRITDSAYATSGTVTTLTVASGATACEGDEFEIYPPFGFKKAALDSGKQKIVLASTASSKLKVVGRGDGFVDLMASEHALGVEE